MRRAGARAAAYIAPTVGVDEGWCLFGVGIHQIGVCCARRGGGSVGYGLCKEGCQVQLACIRAGGGTTVAHKGQHIHQAGVGHWITDAGIHKVAGKVLTHLNHSLVITLLQQHATGRIHVQRPVAEVARLA